MSVTDIVLIVWNLTLFIALVVSIRANLKWVELNNHLLHQRDPWQEVGPRRKP